MGRPILFLAALLASLCSCTNNSRTNPGNKGDTVETAIGLDERFKTTDSLVIVFYNDPYGEDSLRYTRYYKQASVTDIAGIDLLQKQLDQPFLKQDKRRNCRSEGKIWCFTGGKIFQTLYFSTRCDDCCYIYLIKEGRFYYTSIASSFTKWLGGLKPLAEEPGNVTPEE